MRKLCNETFIEKSKLKHGDKYDYSKAVYNGLRNKVIIICKKHGEFLQSPDNHIYGKGCRTCAYITTSEKLKDPWTREQEEFLIANYKRIPTTEISKSINKCPSKIHLRAKHLKLTKKHPDRFNEHNIINNLWKSLVDKAKRRDIGVYIKKQDIYDKLIKQNRKCALSGENLVLSCESKLNTVSVDRIDSDLDYTVDNIQIVHKTLNLCKRDLLDEQFYKFCKMVYFNLREKYEIFEKT